MQEITVKYAPTINLPAGREDAIFRAAEAQCMSVDEWISQVLNKACEEAERKRKDQCQK